MPIDKLNHQQDFWHRYKRVSNKPHHTICMGITVDISRYSSGGAGLGDSSPSPFNASSTDTGFKHVIFMCIEHHTKKISSLPLNKLTLCSAHCYSFSPRSKMEKTKSDFELKCYFPTS